MKNEAFLRLFAAGGRRALEDGLELRVVPAFAVLQARREALDACGEDEQTLGLWMNACLLARAIYRDAPVLVLDEPTAALDPLAEYDLYQRFAELSEGRTSIFISHRLSSTRFCDRILLLEDGHIVESGTHDELMRQNGKYAALFRVQAQYYQEEGVQDEAV